MPPEFPPCFYRVSVKGLVLDETGHRFLLVKEEDGRWAFPGGGLDHGESAHDCLRREVKEEMGLEVAWIADAPSFFLSGKMDTLERRWVVNVLYEIKLAHLNFSPSRECVKVHFFTPEEAMSLNAFSNIPAFVELFKKSLKN